MAKKNALIIFAKAPVPGHVKTRLESHLSKEECASLHESFITDTVRLSMEVAGADIFLACHPDAGHPFFQDISADYGVRLTVQKGDDLGERMDNAIKDLLAMGYKKVVIIGSDSPDLPPEYVKVGFERLDSSDMVLGPSMDGGYYLIGGRKGLPVFSGIPWSSSEVFEMTLERAGKNGITFSVLKEWYDIDTWEDLQRFRNSIP